MFFFFQNELYRISLNGTEFRKVRDSLCKVIYANIFQYVISHINKIFGQDSRHCKEINTTISILDIAGFGEDK